MNVTNRAIDLIKRDHAEAKAKLRGPGPVVAAGTRQRDYWQGVYDALDNLLVELNAQ